jgi:hypothetical protein
MTKGGAFRDILDILDTLSAVPNSAHYGHAPIRRWACTAPLF